MAQHAFFLPEPTQPDGRIWRVLTSSGAKTWTIDNVTHAAPEPPRRGLARWFSRRRPAQVIDLRTTEQESLPNDPESVVLRLARLRDAGLITNAEFEAERRSLLGPHDRQA
jgi:hypothetical protein